MYGFPRPDFLTWSSDGIAVSAWMLALVVAGAAFASLLWTRRIMAGWLGRFATATATGLDDFVVELINGTYAFFLLLVALYAGSLTLPLGPRAETIVGSVMAVGFMLQLGLWGNRLVVFVIARIARRQGDDDYALATAMGAMSFLAQLALWSIVALLILSSLHINITALIAGLGVGGVAVALAVQNILGDLFASLSIVLDKPFAVGHFIVVDDLAGTVEHVGIKSTRIRSLSGEELVLSNGDLLKSRIHNYRRLFERRILFGFGVTYDTGRDKLRAIPAIVREIIEGMEKTRFDRAHFKQFGASSLDFEVVYFVLDPDYNLYMDIQQEINFELYRRFDDLNIEFAFPTRTLHVRQASPTELSLRRNHGAIAARGDRLPETAAAALGSREEP